MTGDVSLLQHFGRAADGIDARRRRVIRIVVAGVVVPLAVVSRPAASAVRGDRLVEDDAEGAPQPLPLADFKPGKPILA